MSRLKKQEGNKRPMISFDGWTRVISKRLCDQESEETIARDNSITFLFLWDVVNCFLRKSIKISYIYSMYVILLFK